MIYTFKVVVTVLIALVMSAIIATTLSSTQNIKPVAVGLLIVEALSIVAIWG